MNKDLFDRVEGMYHELAGLDGAIRKDRLGEIERADPVLARTLRGMFENVGSGFLDADTMADSIPEVVEIALDGSVVLGGRFTIRSLIGIGGSSSIFRASMTNPDRDVAIKVLRFGLESDRARARFERESIAQASVAHPHIAHIYESGIERFGSIMVPWIAMELVEGARTIQDLALDQSRTADANRVLFVQILSAVKTAHEQGVVHLDLNASNVLIDRHGLPRIIDFGLAGYLPGGGDPDAHVGTRISMAPEQLLVRSTGFDARTDIYALALLYVELVHGVRLQEFPSKTDDEARRMIRIGKPLELLDEIQDLDDGVREVLGRMLRVDPEQRPGDLGEVMDAFARVSEERARGGGVRWKLSLSAMLMLIIVIGVVGSILDGRSVSDNGRAGVEREGSLGVELSTDEAMSITGQNPRRSAHVPQVDRVIDRIADTVEANGVMSPEESGGLHASLADRYRVSGRFEESIEQYLAAIHDYEMGRDPGSRDRVRLDLAELLLYLGRVDEAERELDQIERGSELDPRFSIDLGIAECMVLRDHGELDRSVRQLEYTHGLVGSLGPDTGSARVELLLELAELGGALGRSGLQISYLEEARVAADAIAMDEPELRWIVAVAFGNAIFRVDEASTHARAISMVEVAADRLGGIGDRFHEAWARRQLGHMLCSAGDVGVAREVYSDAYRSLAELLGEDHHEALVTLGYLRLVESIVEDSQVEYEDTLSRLRKSLGQVHPSILRLEEFERALRAGP